MRRLFTTSLFALLPMLTLMAQYTTDGYYRVRNFATKRYIYITDNTGSYDMSRDVGDFGAIQLWTGEDRPISDPASIIYIHKTSSGQFDLQGQNTGIFALVKRFVDIAEKTSNPGKGTYTVGASSHGVTRFLCDMETSTRPEQGAMGTLRDFPHRNWEVFPVSASTTSYFGIKPNVTIGLKRYYPFYAAFPFELHSSGLKAYIISKVDQRLNMAVLKELTGVIPAMTPVIIECPSAQPTSNRLELTVSSAKAPAGNLLGGVFFCNNERPKSSDALTPYNKQTMRLLGRTSSGKLGFISTSKQLQNFNGTDYLPANQAYLNVQEGTASELTVVTEEEYKEALANIKYTITYMVDGKVYKSESLKPGQEVTPPEAPEKEGYTFSGWSDLPSTMPEKDITITANYTVNSYKVIYMVDGEEYASQTVEYGSSLAAIEEPEKEGYTFSGWSEIPSTMPASDVTVTGTFNVNTYIVTYVVDGETIGTQSVEYGSAIEPITPPEKENYEFTGWEDVPETMPAHDVTIKGKYEPILGIEDIYTSGKDTENIYDLSGRRKQAIKGTGIYIIKGKKIAVRK